MFRFLLLLLLPLFTSVQGNVDFSEKHMRELLDLEHLLLLNLEKYAQELQQKLNKVQSAVQEYRDYVKPALRNPQLYLANPMFAFRLSRHLTQDWTKWQLEMEQQLGADQLQMQRLLLTMAPKDNLIQLSSQRLLSILKFYNHKPETIFRTKNKHLRLTAKDCYYLGVELHGQQLQHEALEWLQIAAANYNKTVHDEVMDMDLWRIYAMLSKVLIKLNNLDQAEETLSLAIHEQPRNEELQQQRQQLTSLRKLKLEEASSPAGAEISEVQQKCWGNFHQSDDLVCDYNDFTTPFLMLAPQRAEELLADPYTLLFRDSIYEREIRIIKEGFENCPPSNSYESGGGIRGCRFIDSYSSAMSRITTRVQDMTGLNNPLEGVYVLEYGPRDTFELFELEMFHHLHLEDIEATTIFFLNDVDMRGAIILPNEDLVHFPRRGEALVSFHDYNFMHIMCPNVVGTSLVMIKFMLMEE